MPLQPATRAFLGFLRQQATIRDQIRAGPNMSLFYAGAFARPFWEELRDVKRRRPELATKITLGDALERVSIPGSPYKTMLEYAQAVEREVHGTADQFILWRALSGIYARNAVGKISFQIGSDITRKGTVFAATEVTNLLRNPLVDETSRDFLYFVQRCIETGEGLVNAGFISLSD